MIAIGLQDPVTLSLSMAVALISVLGVSLKETNLISGLIEGLRTILPGQVLLAIIPALFGLLSMPGGAMILMTRTLHELRISF